VLDARYERVREAGVVQSRAVLVAIGIDWQGRRRVIGVELANRESATSWKEFLVGLKQRRLRGVRLVVSDQHEGLKRAVAEVLTEAAWQRCYVHFLRNALDHLPRKNADDCLLELRWLYDRRDVNEARQDLVAWVKTLECEIPQAVHLGGREHRDDVDLLPAAAGASQAHEEHQHARAAQPGVKATYPCDTDLP